MSTLTTNTAAAWTPADILELVVQPVAQESIAARLGLYRPGLSSDSLRVPLVTADPSASWVPEGAEIPVSESQLGETDTPYFKLAGLSVISRELAEDSSPSAAQEIGNGLVRDIARKLDGAMFAAQSLPNAPSGLGTLTGATEIAAPAEWANLDPFKTAKLRAASLGTSISGFVVNDADAEKLLVLKEGTTSNRDLIDSDGTAFMISGTPVIPTPYVPAGTAWGIPSERVIVGVREDANVSVDTSAFFTSDRVAIRATMRVAFAFTHPAAVMKIVQA